MIDFKKIKESELFYFLKILLLTIFICSALIKISNKYLFKKVDTLKQKVYQITVKDYICKCNIKYYSDTVNIDKLVYFKSEGIEYEIDSSLIVDICIKY